MKLVGCWRGMRRTVEFMRNRGHESHILSVLFKPLRVMHFRQPWVEELALLPSPPPKYEGTDGKQKRTHHNSYG